MMGGQKSRMANFWRNELMTRDPEGVKAFYSETTG